LKICFKNTTIYIPDSSSRNNIYDRFMTVNDYGMVRGVFALEIGIDGGCVLKTFDVDRFYRGGGLTNPLCLFVYFDYLFTLGV
jgi:hypothetical protein